MKRPLLALALIGLLSQGAAAQPDQPLFSEKLRQEWRTASPTHRLAARQMLQKKYADLPERLLTHLEERYPGLEVKVGRALLSLDQKVPGLVYSLPRHLLEDLGDEPAQALLDVKQAVLARYPQFPQRMAQLRAQQGPARVVMAMVRKQFPGFRTDLLGQLEQKVPDAGLALRSEAIDVMREKHRGLGLRILRDLSELADQKAPDLPDQLARARAEGQRPLAWLAQNQPGFLLEAARMVHERHGKELRSVAVEVLDRMEQRHPHLAVEVASATLDLVEQKYAGLPSQVRHARLAARREFRQAVLAEFPELPSVVAQTMEAKHPQLLEQALSSVERHYPGLKDDLWAALEGQLPGLRGETRSFLDQNYPQLEQDLEAALRG